MPTEKTGPDLCYEMQSASLWTVQHETEYEVAQGLLRLLYITDGQCRLLFAGTSEALPNDRMLILRGPVRYRLAPLEGSTALACIDITRSRAVAGLMTLQQLTQAYATCAALEQSGEPVTVLRDQTGFALNIVRILVSLPAMPAEERRLVSGNLVSVLLASAMRIREENCNPTFGKNPHVRKALRYLHENCTQNATVEGAAQAAGVHPVYLARLFSGEQGMHIRTYLTRMRIDRAKTQLARTCLPVQTIATRCGFSSHPYFTRVFQRETGLTPLEYRHSYDMTCDYGNYEKHIGREVSE
ncbi:MAG: helix-turn-helix transcriptional regulator [Clostridiales bacterium]|nr:helix-turn-helix transcriptional regulator [Clostridiales bacterium]